jgi:hypothetical protein
VKLTLLYTDPGSAGRSCPTVYLAENGQLVIQGDLVDDATAGELANVRDGEGAVVISPEIIIGAMQRYTAQT